MIHVFEGLIPDYREMGCAVECHEHINRVVQELLAVRQSLNTCTISIRLLKLILKHKDTYCHITQYFIHDDTSLDDILLTNEHALQVFTEFRENVAHTTQLCRDMVGGQFSMLIFIYLKLPFNLMRVNRTVNHILLPYKY